jgi:hypothetical protein
MSLAPVTSHPRFAAAATAFETALPLLNPTTRFPTSIPSLERMKEAGAELRIGIAELYPMQSPSTQWLHQPARLAIAQAERAIELLRPVAKEVGSGALDPSVGSEPSAAAVREAREAITRAIAAATL